MLAYRHGFHAGMHADVLKHLALMQVLLHVGRKEKPYTYLDTHAGAGTYALDGAAAHKTGEFRHGIGRLWRRGDLPGPLADYVALVRRFNVSEDGEGADELKRYPGSPAIAAMLRRDGDRMRLYELHPTDHRVLEAEFGRLPQCHVAPSDGFAALRADLPPPSRRGVVLVDPSYEIKTDYARVAAALRETLTRFADAVAMVWYPQLQLLESAGMAQRLKAIARSLAPRGWLHVRLTVQRADERGFGLQGSGVFVANPPFGVHDRLAESLPFLSRTLGHYEGAHHLIEQHAA